MSIRAEVSWDRVQHVMGAGNPKDSDEGYTMWAPTYDRDMVALNCNANTYFTTNTMEFIANSKSAMLLDVAAGTGLCGAAFRDRGYEGTMDAIELNGAMLKIAEEKKIYRFTTQFKVSPDTDLPVKQGFYDTVVCSGSFAPDQVHERSILPMLRALKSGGILAFNTRNTEQAAPYKARLDGVISELEAMGDMKKLRQIDIFLYEAKPGEESEVKGKLYICKKL